MVSGVEGVGSRADPLDGGGSGAISCGVGSEGPDVPSSLGSSASEVAVSLPLGVSSVPDDSEELLSEAGASLPAPLDAVPEDDDPLPEPDDDPLLDEDVAPDDEPELPLDPDDDPDPRLPDPALEPLPLDPELPPLEPEPDPESSGSGSSGGGAGAPAGEEVRGAGAAPDRPPAAVPGARGRPHAPGEV
ncbi:MAG: hypothetical protein JJT89_18445 [Nitriliruptoraceae bacterium]|nr:hypothetical protein [Nitriliruptoraceae bacterium]